MLIAFSKLHIFLIFEVKVCKAGHKFHYYSLSPSALAQTHTQYF